MKTLEQIKNDYAISVGCETWENLVIDHFHDGLHVIDMLIEHENEVMKIYAMECLKLANNNLQYSALDLDINDLPFDYYDMQESIINENNIIK